MTLMQSFLGLSEGVFFFNAAVSTSVPTHQAGDIILSYKVQSSTSGFPTTSTPSGWTLLNSGQAFVGLVFPTILYYTASLAYKIATDSSTPGWGTNELYAVYRGPTGVGAGAINVLTGSWPALSPFQNTNGTSLIMGLGNLLNDTSGSPPDVPDVSGVKSRFSTSTHRVWDSGNRVQGSSWSSYPTNKTDLVYATVELKF